MENVLGKSHELNRLVSKVICQVLDHSRMENVDYAFVHSTAGCYLAFHPASANDPVLAMTLRQQEAVRASHFEPSSVVRYWQFVCVGWCGHRNLNSRFFCVCAHQGTHTTPGNHTRL